jgi:hypothetical protein
VGFFDDSSVHDAYSLASAASAGVVVAAVIVCYLLTRKTMGPAFKVRWIVFLFAAGLLSGAAAFLVLQAASTHALAGSCESDPSPFLVGLPTGRIVLRAIAAIVWGWLAYVLFAWLCTISFGRWAGLHNGFFHNRGWPPWSRAFTAK